MLWRVSEACVDYASALSFMEDYVNQRIHSDVDDLIWLLEHPPLYTRGYLSCADDLMNTCRLPVFDTSRGGQYTYHGPGQRIAYVMVKMGEAASVRQFVEHVEAWVGRALSRLGVLSFSMPDKPGVWVHCEGVPKKIASLGFRFKKRVSYHGVGLNVSPNMAHFSGIHPCGMPSETMTSLQAMGICVTMPEVDAALQSAWENFKQ